MDHYETFERKWETVFTEKNIKKQTAQNVCLVAWI